MAEMALTFKKRIGKYNLLDTSEESMNINMTCMGHRISMCFATETDAWMPDTRTIDPYDALYIIDEWERKTWISTNRTNVRMFANLITLYAWHIRAANKIKKRHHLESRIRAMQFSLKQVAQEEYLDMPLNYPKKKVKNA